jgi:hypothetical protein
MSPESRPMVNNKNIFIKVSPFTLWLLFFFYSLICGLIFFEFVIPNISSLHDTNSSLAPDSNYFNNVAIQLAEDINQYGWSYWRLYPSEGAGGQSSFLAILYFFLGEHPVYAIPFNAFFHALSGILIYLIVLEILGGNPLSRQAAIISACLYVMLPSSMTWVGQIHKEACLGAGFLLALWAFMKILSDHGKKWRVVNFLIAPAFSLFFIASMKPYMLQILALSTFLIIFFKFIKIFPSSLFSYTWFLIYFSITIGIFFQINNNSDQNWLSGESYIKANLNKSYLWKTTDFLPEFIDRKIQAIASSRASLISSGLAVKANSMIDIDHTPDSVIEVIKYSPRALQVSFFAPFPNAWFKRDNILSLISSIEMTILYITFFGLLFFIPLRIFNYKILLCLIFACLPLLVFGISCPNAGTLYRIRYTFEMIVVMLGICGWKIILNKINKNSK